MSAAPTEPVQHVNDPTVAPDTVTKTKADAYKFTVLLLTLLVLAIVMITTVTGQWVKKDNTAYDNNYYQYDLWTQCQCLDADVAFGCSKLKNLFRAAAGFSVIAMGCEFIAIVTFLAIWCRVTESGPRMVGIIFAWLAVIALILSWTIFVGAFNQKYCGEKVKYYGDLHWAFGIRVGESILAIILAILYTIWHSRPVESQRNYGRIVISFAILIFVLGLATTTGRGWVIEESHGQLEQFSLWEACNCTKVKHYQCREERRLFRTDGAFAVFSIFFTALLFWFVQFSLPRWLHVVVSFFSWATIAVTWIIFSSWFNNTHCGNAAPQTSYHLYWPYGLNVIAFIVMVVNFVVTIVGACRLF